MTILDVRNGALSARVLRISSENSSRESPTVNTVGELLDILRGSPVPELPVLKTTCSRLADYLGVQIDRMTIDMVNHSKDGFRPFLEERIQGECCTVLCESHPDSAQIRGTARMEAGRIGAGGVEGGSGSP